MIQKTTLFLFLIIFNFCLYGQTPLSWTKDSTLIKAKAKRLTEYYKKSISGKETLKNQALFFNEFPQNFSELNTLFGFEYKSGKEYILYSKSEYISELFNTLTTIPKKEYFHRLIKINIGGKYEADAIAAFQHGMREHFIENPEIGFSTLGSFTQKEIDSFWKYYFDSPHPEDEAPEEFEPMKNKYPKIYASMLQGLKYQQNSWKDE